MLLNLTISITLKEKNNIKQTIQSTIRVLRYCSQAEVKLKYLVLNIGTICH